MLEVMRVLVGYESSWKWDEGADKSKGKVFRHPEAAEAGAWQVSWDSMRWGQDLKDLVLRSAGADAVDDSKLKGQAAADRPINFQRAMKQNHELAMEYIARLPRYILAAARANVNRFFRIIFVATDIVITHLYKSCEAKRSERIKK